MVFDNDDDGDDDNDDDDDEDEKWVSQSFLFSTLDSKWHAQGVPQGSILRPVLINSYANDLNDIHDCTV